MSTPATDIAATARKADAFRAMHAGPGLLVLPNAWDAGSARVFAAAGFAALATTSGGVAGALGYADHEAAPVAEMLASAGRITRAVDVPVTVDFESGYGLEPSEIARQLIAAGAAGMNLEDSDHRQPGTVVPAEAHAERLAAVKAAARGEGVDLVLNARVDVFMHRLGAPDEQLAEGLRRARLYRDAGADCIYPIVLADEAMLTEIIAAVGTINVNVRRGGPITPGRALELGVRRITYATSLYLETMRGLEAAAQDVFGLIPPAPGA